MVCFRRCCIQNWGFRHAADAAGGGANSSTYDPGYTGFANPSYSADDYAGDGPSPGSPTSVDELYNEPNFVDEGALGSTTGTTGYLEIDPTPYAE